MKRSLAAVLRSSYYGVGLLIAFTSAAITSRLNAAGYTLTFPNWIQINGPDTPADAPAWLAAMQAYRTQQAALLGYDDSVYQFPALNWTQHNPIQPQAMAHDRYFYDVTTGTYTVDKYLADVGTRYGGIDSILIWPTYPNLGVDSRNQDQLIRDMPGFPNGVKKMIADFHRNDFCHDLNIKNRWFSLVMPNVSKTSVFGTRCGTYESSAFASVAGVLPLTAAIDVNGLWDQGPIEISD